MIEEVSGLVISCARTMERNTASEIYYLLNDIMKVENVNVEVIKELSGIVIVTFSNNSIKVMKKIEEEYKENQAILRYTLKLVPFQYKTRTTLDNIKLLAAKLKEEIGPSDQWKIQLRRRHCSIERDVIIKTIAQEIEKGKVDLINPNKHIIIEIIGKWTYAGVSTKLEVSIAKLSMEQQEENREKFTF